MRLELCAHITPDPLRIGHSYPLKRKRVASSLPRPSRGATFRRRYEFVKSGRGVSTGGQKDEKMSRNRALRTL